jgi:hypothetical protein
MEARRVSEDCKSGVGFQPAIGRCASDGRLEACPTFFSPVTFVEFRCDTG